MSHLVQDVSFSSPSEDEANNRSSGPQGWTPPPSYPENPIRKKKKKTSKRASEDVMEVPMTTDSTSTNSKTMKDLIPKKRAQGVSSSSHSRKGEVASAFADGHAAEESSSHLIKKKETAVPVSPVASSSANEEEVEPGVVPVEGMPKYKVLSPKGKEAKSRTKSSVEFAGSGQAIMMPVVPILNSDEEAHLNPSFRQSFGDGGRLHRDESRQSYLPSDEDRPGAYIAGTSAGTSNVRIGRIRTADTANSNVVDLEAVAVRATPVDEDAYRNEVRQQILQEQEQQSRQQDEREQRHHNDAMNDSASLDKPPLVRAVHTDSYKINEGWSRNRLVICGSIGAAIIIILAAAIGLAVGLSGSDPDPAQPTNQFQSFCDDINRRYSAHDMTCTCDGFSSRVQCTGSLGNEFLTVELVYQGSSNGYSGRSCICQDQTCEVSSTVCVVIYDASKGTTSCEMSDFSNTNKCGDCIICKSATPFFEVDVTACPDADPSVIGCVNTNVVNLAFVDGQVPSSSPITLQPTAQVSGGFTASPAETTPTPCEDQCQGLTGVPVAFSDPHDLKRAVLEYIRDPESSPHGSSINCWDVSQVTDMSFAFGYFADDFSSHDPELHDPILQNFNEDLHCWDTSSVTSMVGMFMNATSFDRDIGDWDVSRVTDMSFMFYLAKSFNSDISRWNVGGVYDMSFMFADASLFNADIGTWDVSSCNAMSGMFEAAELFNAQIGGWDTSNVLNMDWMFNMATRFNQPIGEWDVSKVTDMTNMFKEASTFSQDLSNWEVGNVRDMYGMFSFTNGFYGMIENWDVSNVRNMSFMFQDAIRFNQPIGSWQTLSLRNATAMFQGAKSFNQPLNNLYTSSLEDISHMFFGASSFAQPLNGWDVSNVKSMSATFYEAASFNHPLSQWNVSQTERFGYMFNRADKFDQPLASWDVRNAKDMKFMFYGAFSYNQDLCAWGSLVDVSETTETELTGIFEGSNCDDKSTPAPNGSSWCRLCA